MSSPTSSSQNRLALIHGPNLNLIGERETSIYGTQTFSDMVENIRAHVVAKGATLSDYQNNSEGAIIDFIHTLRKESNLQGLIVNLGAYSHTSVAIYDALKALSTPLVEVHISNIAKRESFRHHSYISSIADGVIFGLGECGYFAAADYLLRKK